MTTQYGPARKPMAQPLQMPRSLDDAVAQIAAEGFPMPRDPVNHPAHYKTAGGLESIDVIEAFDFGFHLGNAFKYMARAGKKSADPIEDLMKARWYLTREIERLEKAAHIPEEPVS